MKYIVSGSRLKSGRVCDTIEEATEEMRRQMRKGASQSGISEISDDDATKFRKVVDSGQGGWFRDSAGHRQAALKGKDKARIAFIKKKR